MKSNIPLFENIHTLKLLDSVGENLLFADIDLTITWFNKCARDLLCKVGPYTNVSNPDHFIGASLTLFYGDQQGFLTQQSSFPYEANIILFERFAANIILDEVVNEKNQRTGYILTWKDVTDYEKEIQESRKLLEEMYTPIIGTAVDEALLVPLTGTLTEDRLENTKEKVLEEVAVKEADYVLFDFTGISDILDENIALHLQQIAQALQLMGVEPIFVGFRPELVHNIVINGFHIKGKTFKSFKQGIRYVFAQGGYALKKM